MTETTHIVPAVEVPPRRFYFEPGFSLYSTCAGNQLHWQQRIEEVFKVQLTARDNWVEFFGNPDDMDQVETFFKSLVRLYSLRKCQLEIKDMELLFRSFRTNQSANLETLWQERIHVSPKKREVLPRSRRQLDYVQAIKNHDVVFGIGPAGTGKTYLAMAMAVSMFLSQQVSRIILTRPARESGERLGFLPGTLEDKVSPYLRPLYDALYEMLSMEEAQELIERQIIEIAPLAFMRGRTLNNAFIILDEAQNTTRDQMLMFLTRMGFGSRCVVTGDPTQSDLSRDEPSGLQHAIDKLQQLPELGFIFFNTGDVVRHALLEKIINAYNG